MNPKHISEVPEHIEEVKKRKDGSTLTERFPRRAVAPYNFVELPDTIVPAEQIPTHNCYPDNRHTGKLKCTLTTSSPLYIRCGMSPSNFAKFDGKSEEDLTDEEQKKKRKIIAPFFDNPANQYATIPGSSLRGMLRTLVEIASYSKIDKVADKQLIYRAFADTTSLGEFYRDRLLQQEGERQYSFLMQAGYLIKTQQGSGWAIQPAKNFVEGASFAKIDISQIKRLVKRPWYDIKHASEVTVHVEPMTWHPHRGGFIELYYAKAVPPFGHYSKYQGVLVETGGMPGKKKMECVIGLPDDEAETIPIPDYPDSMIQEYKEQLTPEQKKKLLSKDGVLKPMHPVFYLIEGGKLIFFGHTMMFRLPYKASIKKFIPAPNYKFISGYLYNSPTLDLTEAIFGFIRDTKQKENQTQAGRVFVSDAQCHQSITEDIWLKGDVTKSMPLKILESPKATTFQHYLVQDSDDQKQLKHYASSSEETIIRGHKVYWHQGNVGESKIEDKNSSYTDIQPIKENVSFDFTIWFENLSEVELGALLWILDIATNTNYRLSLGMGKPLGMGAVQIRSQLSLSIRHYRYTHLFQESGWGTGENFKVDPKEIKKDCLQKFEDYVLKHTEAKSKHLHDVPRIKSFLTMLCWPGVAENSSRYMEIERKQQPCIGKLGKDGKTNEYKNRPVLPTPLQVMKDDRKRNYPGSIPPSSGGGSNPAAWQRPR